MHFPVMWLPQISKFLPLSLMRRLKYPQWKQSEILNVILFDKGQEITDISTGLID